MNLFQRCVWWLVFRNDENAANQYCTRCGFKRISHIFPGMEFDIDRYPCGDFQEIPNDQ